MSGSLINASLNGTNSLDEIELVFLWSKKEIKMTLLFVSSKEEMY